MTFLTSSFRLDCRSLATTGCERETHRPVYARSMSVEGGPFSNTRNGDEAREPDRAASADAPRTATGCSALHDAEDTPPGDAPARLAGPRSGSRAAGPFGPGSSRSRRTSASTRSGSVEAGASVDRRLTSSAPKRARAPVVEGIWLEPFPDEYVGVEDEYEAPDARRHRASRSRSSQRCSTAGAAARGPHPCARCSASAREVAGRWRRAQRR